jgi:class 3 adenylate cyclase/tetratricopeptide (TPR) repeat protein
LPPAERRLLAIMFTDIKGYSAMVGAHEARTLAAVTEHRALVRESLARHGGHEHRTTGDGFLVLFESAVNAVLCAIEIQERMLARNAAQPPAEQLWLRIGLNVGEVVYDADGDVFGDAVNIAARVEPQAPPGGVAFTETVAVAVRGHVSRPIEPMGRLELKNIASPPQLFRVVVAPLPAAPKRLPWDRIAVVGALLAVGALGWALWPEPPRWPTVSQDPKAQQHFEAAVEAVIAGHRMLAMREMEAAAAADPAAPLVHAVGATEPIWFYAGDMEPAVALVEGRSDDEAELVRLCAWTAADGDDVAEGKAWDAWAERHPDDELGAFLRAAHYPRHADDNVHSPKEVHTNELVLREFVGRYPEWTGAKVLLARELHQRAEPEEAIALLTETAQSCRCPLVWQELGEIQLAEGRLEEAQASFQTALDKDASNFDVRYKLADIALERGDEEKRASYAAALMSDTSTPHERFVFAINHGGRLMGHGRFGEGIGLMQQAMGTKDLPDFRLWNVIVFNEIAVGEADRAEEHLEQFEIASRDPAIPPEQASALMTEALVFRVYIAFLRGDAAETRRLYERLAALPPDRFGASDQAGMLYNTRWRALALENKREEALASIRKMYGCWPKWAEARTLHLTGDVEGALAAWAELEDPKLCGAGFTLTNIEAHIRSAAIALERSDADYARRKVELVRRSWTNPDPDLKLTRELLKLEAALTTTPG